MRYELIVIWSDGAKDTYGYDTREQAQKAARNLYTAFGRQIAWTYVQKAR